MMARPGRGPVFTLFAVLALLVVAGIAAGMLPRMANHKTLLAASDATAHRLPVVLATAVHFAASKESIELPGDLQAIIESAIFARADGYLKERFVDIGDRVKAGQPMADIETPELDQQISQARATRAQSESALKEMEADIELSRANLSLAQATLERWQHLAVKGVVSKQDLDQRNADFAVKQAQTNRALASLSTARETLRATDANLHRLEEMKAFSRVTAPFEGVVTARNVDVGTLINAGNGGASREMFRVARIHPLRVFVNVPQAYVAEIHNGQPAELRVQDRSGEVFPAHVTNISNSLDAASRSMLVILETPNSGAKLYPGMYAQVRFATSNPRPLLRIPGDALMVGKAGTRVAVVGSDHLVHIKGIAIGQDLGSEIEVVSGLQPGELVISNPTDAVTENALVDVRVR